MRCPSKNRSDPLSGRRDALSRIARFGAMALSGGLLAACDGGEVAPSPSAGATFPSFSLPDVEGAVSASAAFAGKPVLFNFWATWCPPCRSEMPALQALADRLSARGMLLAAISVDDDRNLVREFLRQERIAFTVLIDRERVLAEGALHLMAYPSSFLVGADGIIREVMIGVRPWADETFAEGLARRAGLA